MSRPMVFLVAAIMMAMLLPASAAAQDDTEEQIKKKFEGVPWEKAFKVESEHYTVLCNVSEEAAKKYSSLMEKLFELYSATFPGLGAKEMKWEVWIYRNRREFGERHPGREALTAGFYSAGDRRIYTYHGLFGVSGSTFNILAHEGMHAFQHAFLKSYYLAPAWLREGMAVVFEGIEVKSDGKLLLEKPPRDRLVQVKVELNERKAIPLADIVGEGAKPFSRRAYAYAGLFIWWLARTGGGERKAIDALLAQLCEREYRENELEDQLQAHLGKNLASAEKSWRAWVRKQKAEYTGQKIPGGAYKSGLYRFSMKRPKSDWVMDGEKAPVDGECIVYKRPRTGGRIGVTVYVNKLPLQADELYIQWLAELRDKVKDLRIEHSERIEIKGNPGFRIEYAGSEPDSKITKDGQRVAIYSIVTGSHIYVIRMQSPPGKWEENREDFTRVLGQFKLMK